MPGTIDVNCDAGESFGNWRLGNDAEIFPRVSSANIACGFHAGDAVTLTRTVKLAIEHDVAIGAHPGLPDLLGFGRRKIDVDAEEVYSYLVYQIGAVQAAAAAAGRSVHHVKLHGAFYLVLQEEERAAAAAEAIKAVLPQPVVYNIAPTEGDLWPPAVLEHGIRFVGEIYPDMAYGPDGMAILERVKQAVDPAAAAKRVHQFLDEGTVEAQDGTRVPVEAESICVHGDGPNALEIVDAVSRAVLDSGYEIAPPR